MTNEICWIDIIDDENAEPGLKKIYDGVRGPNGQLDNLYQAFSLRPHTIKPADDLYRAALHHDDNALTKHFSELIGTYVAILTGCDYAEAHHGSNFKHLHGNEEDANHILTHLRSNSLDQLKEAKQIAALRYVNKLCMQPEKVVREDVETLTAIGWSDGEVLEIVQVVSMFSYFTRVINGIGISLGDEKVGLY